MGPFKDIEKLRGLLNKTLDILVESKSKVKGLSLRIDTGDPEGPEELNLGTYAKNG